MSDDDDLVAEARRRAQFASDAESENRTEWLNDLRFLRLEQWPAQLKSERESDLTSRRPALVLDKCNQHVRQIVNEIRKNRPSIKTRPAGGQSDVETADVFSGVIRHVEYRSNADAAYITAAEHAVQMGRGAFRILTNYEHPGSFRQRATIEPIYNQFSVYLDPEAMAIDGSDLSWAFIMGKMPKPEFEHKYPSARSTASPVAEGYGNTDAWYDKDSVRLAEYFYRESVKDDLLLLSDGTTEWGEKFLKRSNLGIEMPSVMVVKKAERFKVRWCKHTGEEILERNEFPSSFIPIIPVYGNRFFIEGEWIIMGAVRAAIDAQRAYNYATSTAIEVGALQPRAPYIGATAQIEGLEQEWERANYSNASILCYKSISIGGLLVPPPQRQAFAGAPQGLLAQVAQAEHDIQAAFGQYQAALGAPSNEKSGIAVRERKIESDMATSHYLWNLAMSITQGGRILAEVIPELETVPGVLRMLGEDGAIDSVNSDPSIPKSVIAERKAASIFNLGAGTYDIVVTVGPGYATRRQEASEGMIAMAQADPMLMQTAGDLVLRNQDWPGADAIADRRKRAIPPEIRGQEEGEDGGEDAMPPQVMQQLQQAQMAVQEAQTAAQQLQSQLTAQEADASLKEAEIDLKRYEAETRRLDLASKTAEADANVEESQANVTALEAQTTLANTLSETIAGLSSLTTQLVSVTRQSQPAKRIDIELLRDATGRVSGASGAVVPLNGGLDTSPTV